MAAVGGASQGGFSYAQAAKGRASTTVSQTPSSKVTSGIATPATGVTSDVESSKDISDDVSVTTRDKVAEPLEASQERSQQREPKSSAIERAKSNNNNSSGVSSPDLAASASSHDDAFSAQNGSSQTSWEAKSQASEAPVPTEPAWIAERKERQSSSQGAENTNSGKASPEEAPPKSLHEAPPPVVNPWTKRAEDAKAKVAALPPPPPSNPVTSSIARTPSSKENQRPATDSRRKANSFQNARVNEDLQTPRPKTNTNRTNPRSSETSSSTPSNYTRGERQSLPNINSAPLSVKDEVSWPTPDTIQDKDRKAAIEEKPEDEKEDESSAAGKPRKKQEWKPVPVVPNIIWETPGVRERGNRNAANGDRPSRGGANSRGRGGFRGLPNGTAGADRSASRATGTQPSDELQNNRRGRSDTADREAMPPPPKPQRASSVSSRHESNGESRPSRQPRKSSLIDAGRSVGTQAAFVPDHTTSTGDDKPSVETQRSSSPDKSESVVSDAHGIGQIPEPIPRRASAKTATEELTNGTTGLTNGVSSSIVASPDGRKDGRPENARDPGWNGSSRGSRRGRGRGGGRDFANGHAHPYSNGHAIELSIPPYGMPASPSTFSPRGAHQNSYSGQNRGGGGPWRGGNNRAQSIPMDYYGRFGNPYSAHPHLSPLQTYPPPMSEYANYPMSAVPYPAMMEHGYLLNVVGTQLDYYFSLDNLLKDTFLRKNMDSQGFVFLEVIANFNRIKQLTPDKELVRAACLNSDAVEIRVGEDGKERLRKAVEWDRWILPIEDRVAAAQTEGPTRLDTPERPMMAFFPHQPQMHMRGNVNSGMQQRPADRRSYDYQYGTANGMPQAAPFFPEGHGFAYGNDFTNGTDESRGRPTKSPIRGNSASPGHQSLNAAAGESITATDMEAENFPDHQVEQLTVCVKLKKEGLASHSAATRTFSNGSIDTSRISADAEQKTETSQPPTSNGETLVNGTSHSQSEKPSSDAIDATSPERSVDNELSVFWIKDNDQPVGTLPSDLTPEPYLQLRQKALDQRSRAATGNCPYDLDVLYQFWSHFLIRNFNNKMYSEFKYFAGEDAKHRHSDVGRRNLVKYYDQALHSAHLIPVRVAKDYVELVKAENGFAFKKLHRSWRDGALNLRNRKRLSDLIEGDLKQLLEA